MQSVRTTAIAVERTCRTVILILLVAQKLKDEASRLWRRRRVTRILSHISRLSSLSMAHNIHIHLQPDLLPILFPYSPRALSHSTVSLYRLIAFSLRYRYSSPKPRTLLSRAWMRLGPALPVLAIVVLCMVRFTGLRLVFMAY
jgi:hypothetical protein